MSAERSRHGCWRLLFCALALCCFAACHPTQRTVALDQRVELRGKETWSRAVDLQPQHSHLLELREHGLHATASVTLDETTTMITDTPLRRRGVQAIVLPKGARKITVSVAAHEPQGFGGEVLVTIVTGARYGDGSAGWDSFAHAGARFAEAQRIRSTPGETADLKAVLQESADSYAAAAYQASQEDFRAQSLLHWARVTYGDLQQYDLALARAEMAWDAFKEIDDHEGIALAQALHAAALMEVASSGAGTKNAPSAAKSQLLERSRQELIEAAESFHRMQWIAEEAEALNNIGLAYFYEGRADDALTYYRRAADLYKSINDAPNAARSLQNIGVIDAAAARYAECSARYAAALQGFDAGDDLQLYGDILNNAALCHYVQQQFEAALRAYGQAFTIHKQLQNDHELARTLQGIGSTYYALGQRDEALQYYAQSLSLRSANVDARGRASVLRAIANAQRDMGNFEAATQNYEEALDLDIPALIKDRTRLQLARTRIVAGEIRRGEALLAQISPETLQSSPILSALATLERARIARAAGDLKSARRLAADAVRGLEAYEVPAEQSDALYLLASIAEEQHDIAGAMEAAERGLAIADELRRQTVNAEIRATLFAPWRRFHDLKIRLIVEGRRSSPHGAASWVEQSLLVADEARSRTLEEYRLASSSAQTDPGLEQAAAEKAQIQRELRSKRYLLAIRLDRHGPQDATAQQLQRELAGLRARLDAIQPAANPAARAANVASAARLSKALDADTAVISYWLGAEDAYAWIVTQRKQSLVKLGASAELARAALETHRALAQPASGSGEALSRALRATGTLMLAPVTNVTDAKRWIVVPDAELSYLPFAALIDPRSGRAAVVDHQVSVAPAVRFAPLAPASTGPIRTALLVADPVFEKTDARMRSDAMLAQTAPPDAAGVLLRSPWRRDALARLPGTAREATAIGALLAGARVKVLGGFAANRRALLSERLDSYDLIHFATHAQADADYPHLSSIALSRFERGGMEIDPFVTLHDLLTQRFSARLVVLSSCETALGRQVQGEGLIGLTYGLLARGADAVVASLWRVSDDAAAELMKLFYRHLLIDGQDAAAALASAQRTMLKSPRWASQAQWSAFVLYQLDASRQQGN